MGIYSKIAIFATFAFFMAVLLRRVHNNIKIFGIGLMNTVVARPELHDQQERNEEENKTLIENNETEQQQQLRVFEKNLMQEDFNNNNNSGSSLPLLQEQQRQEEQQSLSYFDVPPYTTEDIARFAHVRLAHFRNKLSYMYHLLVFDGGGGSGTFQLFSMRDRSGGKIYCDRAKHHFIELLIEGMLRARPNRFDGSNISSPPFQLLLSTGPDFIYYGCVEDAVLGCSKEQYPPVVTIASVTNNSTAATFLKQYPLIFYNECLFHMLLGNNITDHAMTAPCRDGCEIRETVHSFPDTDDVWNNNTLIPQVYWRGSEFNFLEYLPYHLSSKQCATALESQGILMNSNTTPEEAVEWILREENLIPRCRAVAMSVQAEAAFHKNRTTTAALPWINMKYSFTIRRRKIPYLMGKSLPPSKMWRYKYQIDLGGNGGTTWKGTITKLAMPGLLFHHETPMKDWFFDEIQPWVHYVPIHLNLSNLYDMFVWAENHPAQAQAIAKKGQEYARYHVSDRHFQATFERYYVNGLARIIDAYQPGPNETLASILAHYKSDGLVNIQVAANCTQWNCTVV